ncbi:hypothetical protein [Mycobacterium uberis]|nr:hypothetical protein [Mycobacterium uberis]
MNRSLKGLRHHDIGASAEPQQSAALPGGALVGAEQMADHFEGVPDTSRQ